MSRSVHFIIATLVLVSLLSVGCGPAATSSPPEKATSAPAATEAPKAAAPTEAPPAPTAVPEATGETLTMLFYTLSKGPYNPATTTGMAPAVSGAIYETLVAQTSDGAMVPGALTESWDESEDGLTYTFHLKEGVTFHDGTPFNSEVVKFFIQEMKTGPSGYMFDQVQEVQTPDEHTAVFVMTQPFPNLLFNLATYYSGIFSPTAYQEAGEDYGSAVIVGTGPYKFVEQKASEFHFERNPDHTWPPAHQPPVEGVVYPEKVIMREITEDATRVLLVKGGEAHYADIPAQYAEEIAAAPGLELVQTTSNIILLLGMNSSAWPFDDLKVRQAFAQAFDREAIIDSLWFGAAEPVYSYLSPILAESKGAEGYGFKYDPDAARALLAEAGWEDTDGDGIVEKDGKPLSIRLVVRTVTQHVHLAEAVQSYLSEIGIETKIETIDTLTPVYESGDWEATVTRSVWSNADILDWWFNPAYIPYPNYVQWADEKTADMIAAASIEPTWDERVEAFAELDQYLTEQALWAPLLAPQVNYALSEKFKGFVPNPFEPMFEIGPIYLEP